MATLSYSPAPPVHARASLLYRRTLCAMRSPKHFLSYASRKMVKPREKAIDRIPCELWQEIFLLCKEDRSNAHPEKDHTALFLSQVCRSWRTAAILHPRLWSSVISVTHQDSPARVQFELARVPAEQRLQVQIKFSDLDNSRLSNERVARVVREVLAPQCSRWDRLSVMASAPVVADLSNKLLLTQPLTELSSCTIVVWDEDRFFAENPCDISFLRTATSLRRLTCNTCVPKLDASNSPELSRILPNISKLTLKDTYMESPLQLHKILSACSSLEQLDLLDCAFEHLCVEGFGDRLVLPELRSITITSHSSHNPWRRHNLNYDGSFFLDHLGSVAPDKWTMKVKGRATQVIRDFFGRQGYDVNLD
ncbi:hypothetical protein BV25DRAFT_1441188 [Artomyces pyxidatus]|uniref:Uncharacterized protein n=1 Tax=Artomyces pyxidatus TaxID=48021 RepID=A0ACB8SN31_9AGAM|nr:hypothetical protein BV25DRAFT_1441188 [Artomyces pyxidatus]